MIAEHTFDSILQQIKNSNLNFQLQLSPFSANISLKKSPIKDQAGVPIPSQGFLPGAYSASVVAALTARNLSLEAELRSLRNDYAEAIDDCAESRDKLMKFEAEVKSKAHREEEAVLHLQADIEALTLEKEQLKAKNENQCDYINELETSNKSEEKAVSDLQASFEALAIEKEKLKAKNKNLCDYIKVLETSNKTAREATDELRQELSDTKVKSNKEKADMQAEHRKRVKSLKKVLGDQTKAVDKLNEKLKDHENNEAKLTDAAVQVPVVAAQMHDAALQVPDGDEQAALSTEEVVKTEDTKKVLVNLDLKSWYDVLERVEKKGIQTLPGGCFDSGGYSLRKTLARLYDKEGLYMCTLGQVFENTTEFSTMNLIGEMLKDEDYKGGVVEGVEELIWV